MRIIIGDSKKLLSPTLDLWQQYKLRPQPALDLWLQYKLRPQPALDSWQQYKLQLIVRILQPIHTAQFVDALLAN